MLKKYTNQYTHYCSKSYGRKAQDAMRINNKGTDISQQLGCQARDPWDSSGYDKNLCNGKIEGSPVLPSLSLPFFCCIKSDANPANEFFISMISISPCL